MAQKILKELLSGPLEHIGYRIAYIQKSGGERPILLIAIERLDEAPVTVGDCTKASRLISTHLDVEDPIRGAYFLEVSSPGLDRPLFTLEDYKRFIGSTVRFALHEAREGQKRFLGVIEGVESGAIVFALEGQGKLTLPLSEIHHCKLVPNL